MPIDSNQLDEILQRAFRYACALTYDDLEAEELVQDACLRVLAAKKTFDRCYLLAAVRSSWVDSHRRRGRRIVASSSDAVLSRVALEKSDGTGLDQDDYSAMHAALARLRPEEREALFLTIGLNQSAAKAARACGKSRGVILSLVSRAKHKIRKTLNTEASEANYKNEHTKLHGHANSTLL